MKVNWLAALAVAIFAAQAGADETPALRTQKDKLSYSIGVNVGRNFKLQKIDVDVELVVKGLKDELSNGKILVTEDEIRAVMKDLQTELRQKQTQAVRTAGIENEKAGREFLASNGKKKDVVTLPDGLQYKILKAGEGKKPTDADTVECHYKGTLLDGTEFDSSYRTGRPVSFKVKGVIPGWTEALKLMPVGSKWQLFIPSNLAYGPRGAGRRIGPNATLIFEVELVAIK
jgi:UDP-GlcNAc:undecaprenyl-phosphate/decaprenyl-phosphate GlcNAc-1-phosphate transferase